MVLALHTVLDRRSALAERRAHVRDGTNPPRRATASQLVFGTVATASTRHASALDRDERSRRVVAAQAPRRGASGLSGQTPGRSTGSGLGKFSPRAALGLGKIPKGTVGIVGTAEGGPSIQRLGGTGGEAYRRNMIRRGVSGNDPGGFVGIRGFPPLEFFAALGELAGSRHLLHHVSADRRGQTTAHKSTETPSRAAVAIDAPVETAHHLLSQERIVR